MFRAVVSLAKCGTMWGKRGNRGKFTASILQPSDLFKRQNKKLQPDWAILGGSHSPHSPHSPTNLAQGSYSSAAATTVAVSRRGDNARVISDAVSRGEIANILRGEIGRKRYVNEPTWSIAAAPGAPGGVPEFWGWACTEPRPRFLSLIVNIFLRDQNPL